MASNVRVDINANDNASKKIKGLAGSFIGAQLAVDGLKKVMGFLANNIGKTIQLGTDFQETNSKLNTIFSDMRGTISNMSQELVDGYGLSIRASQQLLGSTGDLLTGMGFNQKAAADLSFETQKLAVDLASFTNIQGGAERVSEALTKAYLGERESLKAVGISISEAMIQQRLLEKGQDKLTGTALQQAKAEATLELALEQSKNAIGDYARTQDSLANRQRKLASVTEDIQTQLGVFLVPIMKELTGVALDAAQGFKEFISSSQTIETISNIFAGVVATFEVAKKVFGDFASTIKDTFAKEITKLSGELGELFGAGAKTNSVMKIFSGTIKIIAIGVQVAIKVVSNFITTLINFFQIIKDNGKVVASFFQALVDPRKWGEFKENVDNAKNAYKDLVVDYAKGTADIVKTVVDGFKDLPKETQSSADEMEEIWNTTFERSKSEFIQQSQLIKNEQDSQTQNQVENNKKQEDNTKKSLDTSFSFYQDFSNNLANLMGGLGDTILSNFTTTFNVMLDKSASIGDKMSSIFSSVGETISASLNLVSNIINENFTSQLDTLQANLEEQLNSISEFYDMQRELIENDGMTKEEAMLANLERLQNELNIATTLEDQQRLQDEIREQQKALKLLEIDKKEKDELEKADKKKKKKEHDLAVKQFNANKGLSIANAIISGAIGLATTWSTAMQLGPIAGPIAAGIISTLITGITAAQIGVIASQSAPSASFENGGIVPGTSMSGDRINVGANSGEAILRADDFNTLVNKIREPGSFGGNTMMIDKLVLQTDNVETLKSQLIELQEMEFARS